MARAAPSAPARLAAQLLLGGRGTARSAPGPARRRPPRGGSAAPTRWCTSRADGTAQRSTGRRARVRGGEGAAGGETASPSGSVPASAPPDAAEGAVARALQPPSNPNLSPALHDYLANPTDDGFRRLCAELRRGPVFVFVDEQEAAMREQELLASAARSGAAAPQRVAVHPLMFGERAADHREDGDTLLVARRRDRLSADHAQRAGSACLSLYTDEGALSEAAEHPMMQHTGLDRVSYVGLSLSSIMPWLAQERAQQPVQVYMNRWTEAEVQLADEDFAVLAKLAAEDGGHEGTMLQPVPSSEVTEPWNALEDRKAEYRKVRREDLRGRRAAALASKESAASLASPPPQLPEVRRAPHAAPELLRVAVVAALLQRPEVRRATLTTSEGEDAAAVVGVDSSDFEVTRVKLAAVAAFLGPALPPFRVADTAKCSAAAAAPELYRRPADLMRLGLLGGDSDADPPRHPAPALPQPSQPAAAAAGFRGAGPSLGTAIDVRTV
eukprot:TRINITY_DN71171_c0_g1_i1.p1 TRINITY_DN71171_c0_g1~~TRINITY_DN71171_c0_g1_i1.p1  ORF type:complete len:499 (+),score=110.05 TRINITY_DN71171_c0_g1_i1:62-1558(+)